MARGTCCLFACITACLAKEWLPAAEVIQAKSNATVHATGVVKELLRLHLGPVAHRGFAKSGCARRE